MNRRRNKADRTRMVNAAFEFGPQDEESRKLRKQIGSMNLTIKRLKRSLALQQRKWNLLHEWIRICSYLSKVDYTNAFDIISQVGLRKEFKKLDDISDLMTILDKYNQETLGLWGNLILAELEAKKNDK